MLREYVRQFYRALIPFLYRRTRYRFFLTVSLESVESRTRDLIALTDYFSTSVRPIQLQAPFGSSMLVLAPHQDDETIGCGGAIALQAKSGESVSIVMLQDGADGHDALGKSRIELMNLRNEESRQAAAATGVGSPIFLNYRSLRESRPEAAERVAEIIREKKADAIFTPFLLDNHPDHRLTNAILAEALQQIEWDVRIFGYEVWGLTIPSVIVVIDSVMARKIAALECFRFANSALDYSHSTKGLNMYRSRLLGAGTCEFAECFFELPRKEFVALQSKLDSEQRGTVRDQESL